jgi:hypothetical protein
MKNLFYLFVLTLFLSCSEAGEVKETSNNETEEAVEEEFLEQTGITADDSTYVNGIIKELVGIEKFAVRDDYDLLLAVLEYNNDERASEVKTIIEKQQLDYYHTYGIQVLDPKSGYIQYAPIGAEVTYTMTYWNLDDGSKLIATEGWGCGPVCSSDIEFAKYENGSYSDLETDYVIPEKDELPQILVPDYDPEAGEPYEFQYVLPRKGKDILFTLDDKSVTLELVDDQFRIN